MDKKNLNDVMNIFKEARIGIKAENDKIERFLKAIPFLKEKDSVYDRVISAKRRKYVFKIKLYDECINALSDMMDYQQGKKLSADQIKTINKATNLSLFPPFIMAYVYEINKDYYKDKEFVSLYSINNMDEEMLEDNEESIEIQLSKMLLNNKTKKLGRKK